MQALVCFVISHKWAIHTLRRYRARQPEHLYVWVHQSRSGKPVERSTEGHRHWTATVLSRLSRTGWTTDHTRARPPPPARSNPSPRPANHRTGHFSNRQVTSITRPATGRAQPEPTPDKRQEETGPGDRGLPGNIYHYINIHFHANPYSHVYIYPETTLAVSDICYDNYQRIRQN